MLYSSLSNKNVSKKQPKKGELELDDLRKNKEINKIVEKQLRYLLKGKKIPISKYKSKKTQCFEILNDTELHELLESLAGNDFRIFLLVICRWRIGNYFFKKYRRQREES
jgi:hypothetical protein